MYNYDSRRKKYFINRHYQGRFMAAYVGAAVLGMALTSAVMMRFIFLGIEDKLFTSHMDVSNTMDIVLPVAVKINLLFFMLGVMFIGLLGVHYSRKADRLTRGMLEWLDGFGKGSLDTEACIGFDHEFPNLDDSLNGMASSSRERVLEMRKLVQEIDDAIAKVGSPGAGHGDILVLKERISALQEKLNSVSI